MERFLFGKSLLSDAGGWLFLVIVTGFGGLPKTGASASNLASGRQKSGDAKNKLRGAD